MTGQVYPLADGLGGHVDVPVGTIVTCNQIGHQYGPHPITDHCLVGGVVTAQPAAVEVETVDLVAALRATVEAAKVRRAARAAEAGGNRV